MQSARTLCGEKQGLVIEFWESVIELDLGEMLTLDLLVVGIE